MTNKAENPTARFLNYAEAKAQNPYIHDGELSAGDKIEHNGDVFILGLVGEGAYVKTEGSIFVLTSNKGTLRGRNVIVMHNDDHGRIISDGEVRTITNTGHIGYNAHHLKIPEMVELEFLAEMRNISETIGKLEGTGEPLPRIEDFIQSIDSNLTKNNAVTKVYQQHNCEVPERLL